MALIPRSDLDVFPLCLGGNVFGGTASEAESFEVLDAFRAGGGNFIDTADVYSAWIPGNRGGESETVLGRWLQRRGGRDKLVIATKVGKLPGQLGLSPENIRRSVEASLKRLQVDHIDLYYAHEDDASVPLEQSLTALDALVAEGKVRYIAASNYSAARLEQALEVSRKLGLRAYIGLQPHYNLLERGEYESELAPVLARHQLASFPYFGLARGFLSGKYRPGVEVESQRAGSVARYRDARGYRVLAALEEVAAESKASPSAVALAWLRQQPTVTAPIASARVASQVPDLLASARLVLSGAALAKLAEASA